MRRSHDLPSKNAALALLLLAGACAHAGPGPAGPDPVEARVVALMDRAREAEPAVTARLASLAEARGGHLYKLEHRLKTKKSAVRKMRLKLAEDPSRTPEDITLQDMLRYTMVVGDQPPGNYVRAVHEALASLEAEGHTVVVVKNYWPTGDNYSGVNSILRTPGGLPWELQFHTPRSLEVQAETRTQYEELRKEVTALPRKRALFDAMTAAWDTVPIPKDVLEQGNLHAKESIRDRERP